MPYGTIKIDTITFTDAGVDKSIAVSGLVQNPTFTGNVTVTGTVSGATVRATTVSGVTVSGTTANFASGVFTTQISGAIHVAPAGTAGAPSVQVGTGASIAPGLYSPATDQLGISTGGSFRLVVDSTGRVGIGTSAPGVKLEVFGASNANEIRSSDGTTISQWYQDTNGISIFGTVSNHPQVFRTNSTERVRIDSTGRVGIGTSSPQARLEVQAPSASRSYTSSVLDFSNIHLNGITAGGTTSALTFTSGGGGGAAVAFGRGGSVDTEISFWTNSVGGANAATQRMVIDSSGNVGIGTSSPSGGLHLANPTAGSAADFVVSNSANNWSIKTGTTTNALTIVDNQFSAERLRIDASGNVGIGTTSPSYLLDVVSSGSADVRVKSGGVASAYLRLGTATRDHAIFSDGVSGSLNVFDVTSAATRMSIDSAGRVGIGTASPQTALHVIGTELRVETSAASEGYIRFVNTSGSMSFGMSGAVENTILLYDRINNQSAYRYTGGVAGFHILATNNTERLRIDSSGNVGIGTSSPNRKLEVSDASVDNFIRVNTTGATKSGIEFASGGTVYSQLYFNNTPPYDLSLLQQYSTGSLILGTNNTERLRIDSSGQLIVAAKANGLTNGAIFNVPYTGGQPNGISLVLQVASTGNTNALARINMSANDLASSNASYISFATSPGGAGAPSGDLTTERLRIDSNGRVGIGTASDGSKLLVYGDGTTANTLSVVNPSATNGAVLNFADSNQSSAIKTIPSGGTHSLGFFVAGANTERMRIDSSGNVLVGTSTAVDQGLVVVSYNGGSNQGAIFADSSTASGNNAIRFKVAGTTVGSITTTSSATTYNTSSDYRLKENIEPVADGITRLKKLNPSRFNFITDPDRTVDGFIAHEVQVVVPEAITGEKDAEDDDGNPIYQGIDQSKLVPLLTAALQEAIAKIETLEAKVAVLESA